MSRTPPVDDEDDEEGMATFFTDVLDGDAECRKVLFEQLSLKQPGWTMRKFATFIAVNRWERAGIPKEENAKLLAIRKEAQEEWERPWLPPVDGPMEVDPQLLTEGLNDGTPEAWARLWRMLNDNEGRALERDEFLDRAFTIKHRGMAPAHDPALKMFLKERALARKDE